MSIQSPLTHTAEFGLSDFLLFRLRRREKDEQDLPIIRLHQKVKKGRLNSEDSAN